MTIPQDLGPYKEVVANASWAVAAAAGLLSTWWGKQKWHPTSTTIERLGILVPAVVIIILFSLARMHWAILLAAALVGTVISVLAGLKYSKNVSAWRYEIIERGWFDRKRTKYVIGGTALTLNAGRYVELGKTIDEILEGSAYKPDRVWLRESRASNENVVARWYLVVVGGGTVALASASMIAVGKFVV